MNWISRVLGVTRTSVSTNICRQVNLGTRMSLRCCKACSSVFAYQYRVQLQAMLSLQLVGVLAIEQARILAFLYQ